ncbi:MAG: hypothetical protein E6230_22005 [Paenibacillus dendritiformis]|uniref:hypothetical protein n=1 Tax=uncultured Paenibacillus sp. TaxID=227322 RepID=UPI0025EB7D77|nr:hypothetical protein [uncultured Paenibacillus sp.]MDU5144850.1 hypothetical protein [Paenibacillus dendritiformis]
MSLTIGKKSIGEKVFDTANVVFLILFSITAVYPFLNVMSISFSTSSAANAYGLKLWPQEVSLDAGPSLRTSSSGPAITIRSSVRSSARS